MPSKLERKRLLLIIGVVAVGIILLLFLCKSCEHSPSNCSNETEKTLDFIPAGKQETDRITIPGILGLNMESEQLSQTVDFYNPERNPCYFIISLYLSDDTLIYQSDYIEPSEHITTITLNQKLQRGIYKNCRLVYQCYSLTDKSKLNSGEIRLEINSQ